MFCVGVSVQVCFKWIDYRISKYIALEYLHRTASDLGKLVCIGTISYYRGNPEKRRKKLARQHVQKRRDNREEEEEQVRKEAQ